MTQPKQKTSWPSIETNISSLPLPSPLYQSSSSASIFSIPQSWPVTLLSKKTSKSSLAVTTLIFCTFSTSFQSITCTRDSNNLVEDLNQITMEDNSIELGISEETRSPSQISSGSRVTPNKSSNPHVFIQIEDNNYDNTPRLMRRKRQAVESSTTSTTPASTTACICPSTSTISTSTTEGGSTSSTTVSGITTTEGECICPGQNTETTIEVETSTDLPVNSVSGRKLRKELLDMELNQFQSKFETKLFKNIPFFKTYL